MKIIIFTASTGGGHKRAAAAIEAKIKAVSPDTKVKVIDAMKTIGRVYDKTVCDGYHFMATKIPKVYGKFYKITDRRTLMYKAVMQSNTMMSAKLLDTINEYKPDAIIMCHPFVTTMVSKLRRQHKIDVKAISLITDYDAHRTYIVPYVDAYVLAEPDMATKLIDEYGVDKSKYIRSAFRFLTVLQRLLTKRRFVSVKGLILTSQQFCLWQVLSVLQAC